MSDDEENANLYTTRASGELHDRLDVYTSNFDGSTSEALRELLDLGLQVEDAGGQPNELKQEINRLQSELDETKEELARLDDRERRLNFITILCTVGVALPLAFLGIGFIVVDRGYDIPQPLVDGILLAAGILILASAAYRIYITIEPAVSTTFANLRSFIRS